MARTSRALSDRGIATTLPLLSPLVRGSVYVVMPASNPGAVIGDAVHALVAASLNVIVVDDGSVDDTAYVARRRGAVVLQHIIARGRRAAVQTGIEHALRRGARYIVTFDAGTTRGIESIPALIKPLLEGRCEVAHGATIGGAPRTSKLRQLASKIAALVKHDDPFDGVVAFTRDAAVRTVWFS